MSLALIFMMVSFFYTSTLKPGEVNMLDLVVLNTINALGAACMNAIAPAKLSEIGDYGTWKFRSENTATYFAFYNFVAKAGIAMGGALSFGYCWVVWV